jgi:AFG3 family protein
MDPFNDKEPEKDKQPKKSRFNYYWLYAIILLGLFGAQIFSLNSKVEPISSSNFFNEMIPRGDVEKALVVNKEYVEVYIKPERLEDSAYAAISKTRMGVPNKGPHYTFTIGSADTYELQLNEAQKGMPLIEQISPEYIKKPNVLGTMLSYLLPFVIIIALWFFLMRRMSGGMGGGGGQIFNIGKSKASLYDKDTKVNITFDDVAGLDEAKEEVKEVVDFLKNPKKYTALGGKIPKGVLLVGPPGTGKTLLAKAMAGEAQVPFFSLSGSDFVEMFVGVGASRVRDLFKQAREKAPCIIFIDEIDAIGRARGKNMFQSNDERENTLNQLLVEMDGFSTDKGVIMLASTNRPDILDTALLRPGRFDRQISIDKPDQVGRTQIFKVHLKGLILGPDINAEKLAAQTPGFAGADIANVCNEAALIAARKNKAHVEMSDFQDAVDRVIGGLEKKNKIISPAEKEIIAYHEAGHAICGWYLEHADPLVKVTIIPRGVAALGFAQYLPKEQYLYRTEQLIDSICMTLGGRAAEEIIFGKISTGAQNDLQRITQLAYAMVTVYGMNDKVGNLSFYDPQSENTFTKPYSEQTSELIDEEVRKLIDSAYQRTRKLLLEKRENLEKIAKALLEKEILFRDDLEKLIGPRPFTNHEELTEIYKEKEVPFPAIVPVSAEEELVAEHTAVDFSEESENDALSLVNGNRSETEQIPADPVEFEITNDGDEKSV